MMLFEMRLLGLNYAMQQQILICFNDTEKEIKTERASGVTKASSLTSTSEIHSLQKIRVLLILATAKLSSKTTPCLHRFYSSCS